MKCISFDPASSWGFRQTFSTLAFSAMLLAVLLCSQSLSAQTAGEEDEQAAIDRIREVLTRTQPDMQVEDISPSPVPGLYAVTTSTLQVIFASADARYFIPGDLYEAHSRGLVNRTEVERNMARRELVGQVPLEERIIFAPEGETRATLTVFTDVDCPYCRQLHGDIEELNDMGIAVHYLAFPRTGMDSPTAEKMISIWCADNPKAMLTSGKRGADIPKAECGNPVARHYQLGRDVGVQGTPSLMLESGQLVNGYVPPETLRDYLLGSAANNPG